MNVIISGYNFTKTKNSQIRLFKTKVLKKKFVTSTQKGDIFSFEDEKNKHLKTIMSKTKSPLIYIKMHKKMCGFYKIY